MFFLFFLFLLSTSFYSPGSFVLMYTRLIHSVHCTRLFPALRGLSALLTTATCTGRSIRDRHQTLHRLSTSSVRLMSSIMTYQCLTTPLRLYRGGRRFDFCFPAYVRFLKSFYSTEMRGGGRVVLVGQHQVRLVETEHRKRNGTATLFSFLNSDHIVPTPRCLH